MSTVAHKKKIRFIISTYGNDSGTVAKVVEESDGEVYYYDSFHRYVYLSKKEVGKTFEFVDDKKYFQNQTSGVD